MFYIDKLMVKGFRNYRQQQLRFHPRLNIIEGDNAQGKTNLLESIYYLSVNRSFRTTRDYELVNWDDQFFLISGVFIKDGFEHSAQASYNQKSKLKLLINKNPVNRYDNLQMFPVVIFGPDDLQIIREGPLVRRRFINLEASRLKPLYLKELKAYQRVLLQRNHLLKEKKHNHKLNQSLEPWDQSLVSLGSSIIMSRIEIVNELEKEAVQFFEKMTNGRELLSLEYSSTVKNTGDLDQTRKNFQQSLTEKNDLEIRRGITLVGPHLDDLIISINGYDTRRYSSQGQKRTAALALKMAEVSLFKTRNSDCPIILLDDVFSEFDNDRRQHLLEFLKDNAGQYFISTASGLSSLGGNLSGEHKIFSVKQGSILDETTGSGS